MLDDVYNTKILGYAGNIPRMGRLKAPDASAKAHSKLCGSSITVDIAVQGGAVCDYAHEIKACALGQAAASIVARHIIGARAEELRALRKTMYAMLKEEGPPPQGRFAELEFLLPVRAYSARHGSTLLVFDALVRALDQLDAGMAPKAGIFNA